MQLRHLRETSIMSLSATIAPHLPFLRRFSRAVSG
ncbi:response regulator, partial [Mesorhizobium sp. M4A.F.Ca.ET.022.05.2.1]